ncbi:MAG: DUF3306 domain-containing protein [Burkholderiales bacterium]|nr:DUF3306 domain-containing protein [Burkholderiales bacterium]
MAREEEGFVARWSRRKREQAAEPADAPKPVVPPRARRAEEPGAPALPPVEALTPESDFSVFMHPKVADALRRTALKKLFRHPDIDLPDPFEPFSGDWTVGEPIPEEMLKTLYQMRRTMLGDAAPRAAEPQAPAPAVSEDSPEPEARPPEPADEPGRQDA